MEARTTAGNGAKPITRLNRAFGPIAAGLILDTIDLATFGPIGLFVGLPVGALMGYWTGQALGLEPKHRGWCALAAGIYCLLPATEFIPLATLLGAYARYRYPVPVAAIPPSAGSSPDSTSEPTGLDADFAP